jgi:DNA repair exonuclease SbcCD ATPase subunit
MGEPQTQSEHPGLETAFTMMLETDRKVKESDEREAERHREIDRIMKETWQQMRETNREMREEMKEMAKETDQEIKEMMKETDRQIKETDRQRKETDQEIKEMMKETDRQRKETDREIKEIWQRMDKRDREMKETNKRLGKQLGELGNRFGEVIESMVEPNLLAKFKEQGLHFKMIHHGTKIEDENGVVIASADYSLQNKYNVMLVEIKVKPSIEDIKDHTVRIQKFRVAADLRGEKTIFLGAIAGVIIIDDVRDYALKNGFYIIKPSGKTFIITVPEKAAEW